MNISEEQKREIMRCLEDGKPLPPKYRFLLFSHDDVELVWDGKNAEVCDVVLPFQTVEQVDEPRKESRVAASPFLFDGGGRQLGGWTNKLIWGDNKFVLSSLAGGDLAKEIAEHGGIKLIYIDPPFDVGADFSMNVEIGGEELTKTPNVLEQIAYRDTWGKKENSYIAMIYERLMMMRDLLADDGSIYVHCDWRVSGYMRLVLDEIFGKDNFVNEIIWHYKSFHGQVQNYFPRKHDMVLFYRKSMESPFTLMRDETIPIDNLIDYKNWKKYIVNEREIRGNNMPTDVRFKRYLDKWIRQNSRQPTEDDVVFVFRPQPLDDVWNMRYLDPKDKVERVGYPTQKPEALIKRIIEASSNEGDLVADFFCGSGTTAAVAEKMGRRWLATDLGKFAIHTTRKRLIAVQRELKAAEKDYRAFALLNMGKYQRQYFVNMNPKLSPQEQEAQAQQKRRDFVKLIINAYGAKELPDDFMFGGIKANKMVVVGPMALPVAGNFVEDIIKECESRQITQVDILAFEFEMGLFPKMSDNAKKRGVSLSPKYIPPEVFDKRAVDKDQVAFYDMAYIKVTPHITKTENGRTVAVTLSKFSTHYSQSGVPGKVIVDDGQVYKTQKDGTRELITKHWSDWVDYWAVDYDYESRPAIIRIKTESGEWEERQTGEFIFENEWQSFRARKNRDLEFTSVEKEISQKPTKIAVKVVDIFGNDTMKVLEV